MEPKFLHLMAVEPLRTLATAPQHRDRLLYSPAWIGEPSGPAEPVLLWHASPFGSQNAGPIPDPQDGPSLVAMNKSTQENAALVEEAASASEAMGEKARELTMKVAFFRLPDEALSALAAGEAPQVKDHPEGQGSGPRPGNRMVMRAKGEPVQPTPKAHQSKPENRAAGPDAGEQWQEF